METRKEQINIRLTKQERREINRRASDRKQKVTDFLRDLLMYGMLPEVSRR